MQKSGLDLAAAEIFRSNRPRQKKGIILIARFGREIIRSGRRVVPLRVRVIPKLKLDVVRRIPVVITVDRELKIGSRNGFPNKFDGESASRENAGHFVDNEMISVVRVNVR